LEIQSYVWYVETPQSKDENGNSLGYIV